MTVEEVSAVEQGIYIEKLRGFPSCHSVIDGISGEELRRQNVEWIDGMWLGFVKWLVW